MIIKTNWINLVGVFISVFVYAIILNLIDGGFSGSLFQSILAALILVCLYGMMFWIMFIVALIVLDLPLVIRGQKNLKIKLGIQWLIISCHYRILDNTIYSRATHICVYSEFLTPDGNDKSF